MDLYPNDIRNLFKNELPFLFQRIPRINHIPCIIFIAFRKMEEKDNKKTAQQRKAFPRKPFTPALKGREFHQQNARKRLETVRDKLFKTALSWFLDF